MKKPRKPLTEQQKQAKRDRDRRYREANRDKIRQRQRAYRTANKEKINRRARERRAEKKRLQNQWHKWWPNVKEYWDDEDDFLNNVQGALDAGMSEQDMEDVLHRQKRATDIYESEYSRHYGKEIWENRIPTLDAAFFYYHGAT